MGPVRCNKGAMAAGPTGFTDGRCKYIRSNKVDFIGTADNAFDIQVTQTRTNSMSEPGMVCMQPATCTVTYKVSSKM